MRQPFSYALWIGLACCLLRCGTDTGPSEVAEIRSPAERDTILVANVEGQLQSLLADFAERTIVSMAEAEVTMDYARHAPLRELAEEIKVSHRENYNLLFQLAQSYRLALPDEPSESAYASVTQLAAQDTVRFDRFYLASAIDYHEWVLEQLTYWQTTPTLPPALRELALHLRDRERQHLDRARTINRTLLLQAIE